MKSYNGEYNSLTREELIKKVRNIEKESKIKELKMNSDFFKYSAIFLSGIATTAVIESIINMDFSDDPKNIFKEIALDVICVLLIGYIDINSYKKIKKSNAKITELENEEDIINLGETTVEYMDDEDSVIRIESTKMSKEDVSNDPSYWLERRNQIKK